MRYTVKKLSEISGVTVRALHHYDEIGLLKPAYHGENGYRYYEEEELLKLQQILFYRELGIELKKIQKILAKGDFNKIAALLSHRQVLQEDLKRIRRLLCTIDKTIEHLKGTKAMNQEEMYWGFSKEKQREYEKHLHDRLGDKVEAPLAESEKNTKNWHKPEWDKSRQEYDQLCKQLVKSIQKRLLPGAGEVQKTIHKHFLWVKQYWNPEKEAYVELGGLYLEAEFQKFYEPFHPKLAAFLAEGMRIYAEREL